MNTILTNEQISAICDILTQYAPDGWTELKMHLVTDEKHTEVTTWAVTGQNPEHGFRLDADDRAVLDELIDSVWKSSGRSWNEMDFSITANGEFTLCVQ